MFLFVCLLIVRRSVESCSRVHEDILKEEISINDEVISEGD